MLWGRRYSRGMAGDWLKAGNALWLAWIGALASVSVAFAEGLALAAAVCSAIGLLLLLRARTDQLQEKSRVGLEAL